MSKRKRIRTDYMRNYHRKYKRDILKLKAKWRVQASLKNGTLQRKSCIICGNEKSQAHHQDYNKPYNVIWLCRKHHELIHHAK